MVELLLCRSEGEWRNDDSKVERHQRLSYHDVCVSGEHVDERAELRVAHFHALCSTENRWGTGRRSVRVLVA